MREMRRTSMVQFLMVSGTEFGISRCPTIRLDGDFARHIVHEAVAWLTSRIGADPYFRRCRRRSRQSRHEVRPLARQGQAVPRSASGTETTRS